MSKPRLVQPADLRGVSRLVIDAITGVTDLVEAVHHNVVNVRGGAAMSKVARTGGVAGLVYRGVRGVTRLVGGGIDAALRPLAGLLDAGASRPEREALLAALNGVLGDHLHDSGNPLAIAMSLRRDGMPLTLSSTALAQAIPRPSGKLLLLVHGLCLNDIQWRRKGHEHGAALARDLGYTPIYLHYNTGLHISSNGRECAALIEALLRAWPVPVEELSIVAHSMGGLVARSAHHYAGLAGQRWPGSLHHMIFLGTPHYGAPLERGGNWIDLVLESSRYTAPFARLGKIRSAGITDLRHGSVLDQDWQGRDRFAPGTKRSRVLPLPKKVRCCVVAATTGKRQGDLSDRVIGDGLVPIDSALGREADCGRGLAIPLSRQWTAYGMNHMDLLSRAEVYQQIRKWLAR
jgi:pimeloyl-ACP methyl ester carboxylesterase